jgi:hypothetical protein
MAAAITADIDRHASTFPTPAVHHAVDHVLKSVEGLPVTPDQEAIQACGFYGDMNSIVIGFDFDLAPHSHPTQETIDNSLDSLFLTHSRNQLYASLARAK